MVLEFHRRLRSVVLLAAFVLTSVTILPTPVQLRMVLCVAALALLLAAIATRDKELVAPLIFCLMAALCARFNPLYFWPMPLLLPLVVYALIVVPVPALRRAGKLPLGSLPDRITLWLIVVTVIVSAIALVAWHQLLHPDLSDLQAMIPAMPGLLLPLAGIGFAIVNAVIEELIWRGILWDMLVKAIGKVPVVIILQAVSFGVFHIHGFPRGAIGVAMATVYGLALGVIRHRTGGLGAAIATHIFADLVIFAVLVGLVPPSG